MCQYNLGGREYHIIQNMNFVSTLIIIFIFQFAERIFENADKRPESPI